MCVVDWLSTGYYNFSLGRLNWSRPTLYRKTAVRFHQIFVMEVYAECVCIISFTTIRPWALISLWSQLDAAAPESSFPLCHKPVSQPALSQTLVGHSVIVLCHCTVHSLVRNLYSDPYRSSTCRRHWLPTCATSDTRDRLKSHSGRETALSCAERTQQAEKYNSLF